MRVKSLVIIFCMLQCLMVFGQKPEGIFFDSHGYTTTTFTFSPDSSFRYEGTGCLVRYYGYGTYRFTAKKLNLYFTDSVKKYTIVPDSCSHDKKVAIRFKVMNRETGLPVPYTGLSIGKDSTGSRVWVTDTMGLATIVVDRKDTAYVMTINPPAGAQKNFSVSVNGSTCQDVLLRIATGSGCYIDNGVVWEYKVIRYSKRQLILKEKLRNGVYYKRKMKRAKTINTNA